MARYTLPFPIIGLMGPAGCGKDTAAQILCRHVHAHIYALASPIKKALSTMLGVQHSLWDDRMWKETPLDYLGGVSPRRLAQTLGTDWGREQIHSDIWLKIAERRLAMMQYRGALPVIITDVRFLNEARWIKKKGGYLLQILRPESPSITESSHESEKFVGIAGDSVIVNDSTLEEFEARLIKDLLIPTADYRGVL